MSRAALDPTGRVRAEPTVATPGCARPEPASAVRAAPFRVIRADRAPAMLEDFGRMRRRTFVEEQGLFVHHDTDEFDADPHTQTLLAVAHDGTVVGGVRLHPATDDPHLGWWRGSRLVCSRALPGVGRGAIGAGLVRAACEAALGAGALRFDAYVQERYHAFFLRLGWEDVRPVEVAGAPHRLMRFAIDRIARLAEATKAPVAALLGDDLGTPAGWLGDDGVPVLGTDVVACTDAITPAMVEDDPEWAGWCGMLVTAHDLSAMGAVPAGALDALGARDEAHAQRILRGLRRGARSFGLPLLGGHLQLGVAGALSVTGLGRTEQPVPAAGGRAGDVLTLTADVEGQWRVPYGRSQWDSTSWRHPTDLRPMLDAVAAVRLHAAKDVSMAGIVGTIGMLAEASGCGAELEVAAMPRPDGVGAGDWVTCFPGFAVVTADAPGAAPLPAGAAVGAPCGVLQTAPGVRLRWPDGEVTTALAGSVTGLGAARARSHLTEV